MVNNMVDYEDPNTWTKEYVISHNEECLEFIREANQLVIRYTQQKNYRAALAGLDRILNGLITMQNSKQRDYRSFISMFSLAEAIVVYHAAPMAPNEAAAVNVSINLLEDARDFATKRDTKQNIEDTIRQIKTGHPRDPQELREAMWILDQMDHELAALMKNPKRLKTQYNPDAFGS